MKRTVTFILCFTAVLGLLQVSLKQAYSQGEEMAMPVDEAVGEALMELSAAVVSVDDETSTLVVEYVVDGDVNTSSTAQFKVSETSQINKGEESLALADLMEGDQVYLQFKVDADGMKVIETLAVQE